MTPNCKDCAYSIFCETWGEYKCTKREIMVPDPEKGCSGYKFAADKKDAECHCEECEERVKDDDT